MKILGFNYKIVSDKPNDEIGAYGHYHADKQLIQIASNLHDQQKTSTMLHEIIEALKYHLQLSLDHQSLMALETGLFQVLTDAEVDLSPLLKEIEK